MLPTGLPPASWNSKPVNCFSLPEKSQARGERSIKHTSKLSLSAFKKSNTITARNLTLLYPRVHTSSSFPRAFYLHDGICFKSEMCTGAPVTYQGYTTLGIYLTSRSLWLIEYEACVFLSLGGGKIETTNKAKVNYIVKIKQTLPGSSARCH